MSHQRLLRPLGLSLSQSYVCSSCLRKARQLAPRTRPSQQRRALQTATTSPPNVPFRKHLKDEAKQKRAARESNPSMKKSVHNDPRLEKWELTVGIEIHAELNTAQKLFSSAATSVQEAPNSHVALFDVAFPGSQPQFQNATLLPAVRAAIALGCQIQKQSAFDRKHYFYQDQPAGYQITQYYEPFARDGKLTLYDHDGIAPEDGQSIAIGIKQVQMEQDTAKTLQQPPSSHLLDFNRVSHPLIEIISLPHIHHPSTAAAYVRKIQSILRSVDAATAGMELGGLRADVNVSVRERHKDDDPSSRHSYYGVTGLGQRTEIKNLSSVKAVEDAIIAERGRQISILEAGGVIEGETRGWTIGGTETTSLRGKEGEVDYRYMPDPDISPLILGDDVVDHLRDGLPALPDDLAAMLLADPYGLTTKDAKTLISLDDGERLDYYMEVVAMLSGRLGNEEALKLKAGKTASNWVLMELSGLLTTSETPWSENPVRPELLCDIIHLRLTKQITGRTAKQLLGSIFEGDQRSVTEIVESENLFLRPMSEAEYEAMATELLDDNPDMVAAIKEKGQKGKVMWFVGQMMRKGEEGTVEAEKAKEVVERLLEQR